MVDIYIAIYHKELEVGRRPPQLEDVLGMLVTFLIVRVMATATVYLCGSSHAGPRRTAGGTICWLVGVLAVPAIRAVYACMVLQQEQQQHHCSLVLAWVLVTHCLSTYPQDVARSICCFPGEVKQQCMVPCLFSNINRMADAVVY